MAAGGSDALAGDVEEDASQLIFPKGEAWGRAIVPPFRVAAGGLALPRGPAGAGAATSREEAPADLEGPGRWARCREKGAWSLWRHSGVPRAAAAPCFSSSFSLIDCKVSERCVKDKADTC